MLCLFLGAASAFGQGTYGPTAKETLWSIATKVNQGPSAAGSTAQMAWALYRANPQAFDGSPDKVRPGATLKIPPAVFVNEIPAAQAYAFVTGKAAPAAAPPAAPVTRPAVAQAAPARAPVVTGIELAPLGPGEPYQWFAVVGSGFAPGAMLELGEAGKLAAVRKPQSVRDNRIEYAARFPAATSRWQVVVRNPDGGRSAPYAFDGGATVGRSSPALAPAAAPTVAAAAQPPPGGAFANSAEQRAALQLAQTRGAEAVYLYLEPLEDRYAGDVDYDYMTGTAALDSGRFSPAIYTLQRAVASRPAYSGARMELARAYYAQGDNESARREFETLQKQDPPPEARRVITEYLAAIHRRAAVYQAQLGGYLEAASGFDSNANGAPDTQTFLGFVLDSRNQATSSSYYGLGAGGAISHPFAPAWRLLGNGTASYRGNPDASFVDSQLLRLSGGIEWRPSRLELSLVPNYVYAMLDGSENHTIVGVDAAATWHFEQAQVSANVRSAQQRFVDELSPLDVDTLVYGLAGQYPLRALPGVQLVGALTLGSDEAVEGTSPFGRDLTGARIGAIASLGGAHAMFASVASINSDYDKAFFSGMRRKDEQLAAALGYEWGGFRALGWVLRAQLNHVANASSVPLYEYDRTDVGVSVRKEFR